MINHRKTTHLRQHHPAWQLLASTKGPLLIAVLQELFKDSPNGIELELACLDLSRLLRNQVESGDLEAMQNYPLEARREVRLWIKRGLLLERQGQLMATDALESALRFVQGLDQRIMSSSASRLAIVQREIEYLEANLNPDPSTRADYLKAKIADLEAELSQVENGDIKVMPEQQAIESIREIYALSTSLSHDFRRVEDSYRDADQRLRQSIIAEQNHRGDIVDKLLDSHDALLKTDEGRVFNGFQAQLTRTLELSKMKQQLRAIAVHPTTKYALTAKQQSDLRWLIMRLVKESEQVLRARARSEKDVRAFLKTGLAAEHHRVGALLNDVFALAINLDWSKQTLRRTPSPLPPVAPNNHQLPLIERLRFKEWKSDIGEVLELLPQEGNMDELDEDFWHSFDGLNQLALFDQTQALLEARASDTSIAELAQENPPSHDLETVVYWLSMAMASDCVIADTREQLVIAIDAKTDSGKSAPASLAFSVPKVALNYQRTQYLDFELS